MVGSSGPVLSSNGIADLQFVGCADDIDGDDLTPNCKLTLTLTDVLADAPMSAGPTILSSRCC